MLSKKEYLETLNEVVNDFDDTYSQFPVNWSAITGLSAKEIIDEFDDLESFLEEQKRYYIDERNSSYWDIITQLGASIAGTNLIFIITYSGEHIVEKYELKEMMEDYDYCESKKELYNELRHDYFIIDEDNPFGM